MSSKVNDRSSVYDLFDTDANKFKRYKAKLNELVNLRNSIAHGENGYILFLEILNETLVL